MGSHVKVGKAKAGAVSGWQAKLARGGAPHPACDRRCLAAFGGPEV